MQSVEKALFVIEKAHDWGQIDGVKLAAVPGWTRFAAHRYLVFLSDLGWLEKVNVPGHPVYQLGRKALRLAADLSL